MPFKSKAQRRFLFSQKPGIAKEFAEATPKGKKLPEKVKKKKVLMKKSKKKVVSKKRIVKKRKKKK